MARPKLVISLALSVAPVAAQFRPPPYAKEVIPDKIEAGYRSTAPYSKLKFQRFDIAPFIFLIEDQGRGNLGYLAGQRSFALNAIIKLFETRYATPLKLKRRTRPLPFWVLSNRRSFLSVGGSKFAAAHFDGLALHTVTYYDKAGDAYQQFHTAMHEAVHQIMFAYTDPDWPVYNNLMSSWLMEGMAEHLSSRPRTLLSTGKDPEFGWIDAERIKTLRGYVRKPFKWKRKASLPFIHHPMYVMTYHRLQQYQKAAGSSPDQQEDYHATMARFYDYSYAVVAFLDTAFKHHFRPKLLKILELEYGRRHSAAVINRVFTPAEKAALPGLFALFVADPKGVAKLDLPKGADKGVASVGRDAGKLYAGLRLPDEATPTKAGKAPAAMRVAKALGDFRRLDLGGAADALDGVDGADAKRVLTAVDALEEVVDDFGKEVVKRHGRAKLFLPETKGKRTIFVSYTVDAWNDEAMGLVVSRKGATKKIALWDVPALLFAEAALKLGVAKTDARRDALGLLVAMWIGEQPERSRKSLEGRARRKQLLAGQDFLARLGQPLAAVLAMRRADAALAMAKTPDTVLQSLVTTLGSLEDGPGLRWLIEAEAPAILARAFAKSPDRLPPLNGKVELLADGRVKVSYDWSDKSQLADWLQLDPKREGIRLGDAARYDASKTKLTVDTGDRELLIHGQAYLCHKLQFVGDFEVETLFGTRAETTKGGQRLAVLGPPLWLFHARKGNTHLVGRWFGLEADVAGRRRKSAVLDREDSQSVFEVISDNKPLLFARDGDDFQLVDPDDNVVCEISTSSVKAEGAILMVQPNDQKKGDPPAGVVRRTTITGVPHPACLATARQAFLTRWLRRLRRD